MRSAAKLLRFPLGGVAKNGPYRDTTYPSEESVYSTPMATNVIGECAFSSRLRGGSRPGLKRVSGVSSSSSGRWLWPNGDTIAFVGQQFTCTGVPEGYTARVSWLDLDPTPYWNCELIRDGETETEQGNYSPQTATVLVFNFGSPYGTVTATREVTRLSFSDLSKATLPDGSTLILQHDPTAIYRDRLVKCSGSVWMASRTGDHGDFDFGGESEDPTRAVAGNLAEAGRAGEPITAMAAFGDQRLFISTRRRLAVVSGEPTSAVVTLSENVGIISPDAWCNAEGTLYFIGQNGLYAVTDAAPMNVSQQLPDDLKGLSSTLLVYDPHYRGIHVFTSRQDYFYDIGNKAFWPVSYPTSMRAVAGAYGVVDSVNRVVFRCADGVYRYWDDAQTTDDGTAIESSVAIGPFKCGVNEGDGMLDEIDVTLANGSAQANVSIVSANTAEFAATCPDENAPSFSFTAGYNPTVRVRRRGAWATLFISSTGRWAYESIYARIKTLGRLRP